MKQTENYQLNQWEAGDRILMADFNNDNAKIEAALADKLGKSQMIAQMTIGSGVREYYADLSGVDWNAWEIVMVTLDMPPLSDTSIPMGCTVCDKDRTTISLYGTASYGVCSYAPGPLFMAFFPHRNAENPIHAIAICASPNCAYCATPFSDVAYLHFGYNAQSYALAGRQITIWGI